MRILVASDIHGSAYFCEKLLEQYEKEGADRLLILGDILYHGPRNDLPKEYEPKKVLAMLNEKKNEICAVRGNCDTEVDQMVLEFPILADYCLLMMEEKLIYATHGHVYHETNLPPMGEGGILLHGHTHLYGAKRMGSHLILNPGSVSIPKGGNPPTYAVLENGMFVVKELNGKIVEQTEL